MAESGTHTHSWILGEHEQSVFIDGIRILQKMPKVVFVKFSDAKGQELDWSIDGLTEKGLYPIVPKTAAWILDKGRNSLS